MVSSRTVSLVLSMEIEQLEGKRTACPAEVAYECWCRSHRERGGGKALGVTGDTRPQLT